MRKTSIVAAVVAAMMVVATGSYAFAAETGSMVKTNNSDLVVMPGAGAGAVRLHFSGAERLHNDFKGGLTIIKDNTGLMHYRPEAYQVVNGKFRTVEVHFRIEGKDEATVVFSKTDPGVPIVVRWGAVMSGHSVLR